MSIAYREQGCSITPSNTQEAQDDFSYMVLCAFTSEASPRTAFSLCLTSNGMTICPRASHRPKNHEQQAALGCTSPPLGWAVRAAHSTQTGGVRTQTTPHTTRHRISAERPLALLF